MKFSQLWRNAPLTFCLASVLDPRLKLVGVETLLEAINNNMNIINKNNIYVLKYYLGHLFMEYFAQMGRLEIPSTPMGPPRP